MGIGGTVARSNLADANEWRDWRIYADFAHALIITARTLYSNEPVGIDLQQTVYALDATTIDLCLSMFPWATFRQTKAAIKLHTLLDMRGSIPTFICIFDGTIHDVNILDALPREPGAFYVMDRGYLDYARLHTISQATGFFVIRAKSNLKCRRVYSHHIDRSTGLSTTKPSCLPGSIRSKTNPGKLRRVKYYDSETGKTMVFLTNNFSLPALTISQLYRCRWQVKLFFKWIKQNLRIKNFYGTSENAVKTQIWIAVSVYVLVAILKKRLNIPARLYTILQILSVSVFERIPLLQLLTETSMELENSDSQNQLILFT